MFLWFMDIIFSRVYLSHPKGFTSCFLQMAKNE